MEAKKQFKWFTIFEYEKRTGLFARNAQVRLAIY